MSQILLLLLLICANLSQVSTKPALHVNVHLRHRGVELRVQWNDVADKGKPVYAILMHWPGGDLVATPDPRDSRNWVKPHMAHIEGLGLYQGKPVWYSLTVDDQHGRIVAGASRVPPGTAYYLIIGTVGTHLRLPGTPTGGEWVTTAATEDSANVIEER